MNTIYLLIDPRTGFGRYLGITRHPDLRVKQHLARACKSDKTPRDKWLRELRAIKARPVLLVVETTDDLSREEFWIKHYRAAGLALTNATTTGTGAGLVHTPEARKKISDAARGKKHSEEWKAHIGAGNRGKKRSPAQIDLLRRTNTGRAKSPEEQEKRRTALQGKPWTEARRKAEEGRQLATHCGKGHEWTAENTRWSKKRDGSSGRYCLACAAEEKERRRKGPRVMTDEVREKCRAGAQRRWNAYYEERGRR